MSVLKVVKSRLKVEYNTPVQGCGGRNVGQRSCVPYKARYSGTVAIGSTLMRVLQLFVVWSGTKTRVVAIGSTLMRVLQPMVLMLVRVL